ncbi:hypothetical protein Efla_002491 [Eimeria flavescens]
MRAFADVSVHLSELSKDEKMARDVERRRQEAVRKERIFCPRQLRMGIDKDALDSQVQQNRDFAKAERDRNAAADQQALYFGAVLELQRAELEHERRQRMMETAAFNLSVARKNQLKKELLAEVEKPPSVEESRAAAGPSSLLVFEGEDASYCSRTKMQQRQQKEAIQEHLFQQALQQQQEKDRNLEYAAAAERRRKAAEALHQQQVRAAVATQFQAAHLALCVRQAEERRQRDAASKAKEAEAESREIDKNLHDPLLAEGRQDLVKGDSALSPSLPRLPTGTACASCFLVATRGKGHMNIEPLQSESQQQQQLAKEEALDCRTANSGCPQAWEATETASEASLWRPGGPLWRRTLNG